jgi:hypothetical protein
MSRIAVDLPDAYVILMLRNPVDRTYSSYQHQVQRGRETLSFEDAIRAEPERLAGEAQKMEADPSYFSFAHIYFSYVARSEYHWQVARCQKLFAPERLLILKSEDFFASPAQVYSQVLRFLNLPEHKVTRYANVNKKRYNPMKRSTRRELERHFKPHNDRLYEVLGKSFEWR